MNKLGLKIIDIYIIKKYISSFGFTILLFALVAMVIDFSEKADAYQREALTVKEVFFTYYTAFVPHISVMLFPMYALITVIFFTSRMASNSEIISIFNAGVSFWRFSRPYLIAAGIMAITHFILINFIVPNGNKRRVIFEGKYIDKASDKGKTDNVHLFLNENTKVFIGSYRKHDSTARDFRIESFENGQLKSILKAETADWQDYPNRWRLTNAQKREFDGMKERITNYGLTLDTAVNVQPEDFVRYNNHNEMLTTPELWREIKKLESRGAGNTKSFKIEINRRTAEPVTIIIVTMIGMTLAARKERGGMGLNLAIGVALGAIFVFLSRFSVTFANQPNMSAFLGVWFPNLIFSIIALFLMSKAQK
ncbi:MAG: YjgP/YjgQ family permease [Saprospiraceae bacterium]|nr:YjgP/YjgQ family permease [Saprospiraceae bacterium]